MERKGDCEHEGMLMQPRVRDSGTFLRCENVMVCQYRRQGGRQS